MLIKLKKIFHIAEAIFAEIIYGFPSRRMRIIGVTGTDGKTTTGHLIYHLLNSSGYRTGMISSIYADTGGVINDTGFHTTTPRPYAVRKYLHQAVKNGCKFFVLETTSHALDQGRVWGVPYEASVITNVTHEHMLEHKTFSNYLKIKTKLLLQSKRAYLNLDMRAFKQVKNELVRHHKQFKTFTTKSRGADFVWSSKFVSKLQGEYNRQNIMGAYAIVSDLGLDDNQMIKGLKTFTLPKGRFDVVYNKKFTIIVDFAHTPHSIDQVLKTVRNNYIKNNKNSLIHVFGSASERDDSKRPLMGENSAKYAQKIILTEEDYRKEDINKIFSDIEKGIMKHGFTYLETDKFKKENRSKTYTKVKNRMEAIGLAVSLLGAGDVLITTGKSHEKSLNRNGVEEPWDEYKAIKTGLST